VLFPTNSALKKCVLSLDSDVREMLLKNVKKEVCWYWLFNLAFWPFAPQTFHPINLNINPSWA